MLVLLACAISCTSPTSYPNGLEYLRAQGFGPHLFAQVRSETAKNINDQVPALLDLLRDSEMVPERPIRPEFTIYLESGSSLPSQRMTIQIQSDGYGVIQHVDQRAWFYCGRLRSFTAAAFDQSTTVVY
ncbi:MAG TPA: hypothetical protein VFY71_04145 [Planctomycetota bacterium]|nr:hypothetical protein [Planctomycetota bacterium]